MCKEKIRNLCCMQLLRSSEVLCLPYHVYKIPCETIGHREKRKALLLKLSPTLQNTVFECAYILIRNNYIIPCDMDNCIFPPAVPSTCYTLSPEFHMTNSFTVFRICHSLKPPTPSPKLLKSDSLSLVSYSLIL